MGRPRGVLCLPLPSFLPSVGRLEDTRHLSTGDGAGGPWNLCPAIDPSHPLPQGWEHHLQLWGEGEEERLASTIEAFAESKS